MMLLDATPDQKFTAGDDADGADNGLLSIWRDVWMDGLVVSCLAMDVYAPSSYAASSALEFPPM